MPPLQVIFSLAEENNSWNNDIMPQSSIIDNGQRGYISVWDIHVFGKHAHHSTRFRDLDLTNMLPFL